MSWSTSNTFCHIGENRYVKTIHQLIKTGLLNLSVPFTEKKCRTVLTSWDELGQTLVLNYKSDMYKH